MNSQKVFLFGYGSLIWRPNFVFESFEAALLVGWKRRFWQASTDHRGTEAFSGRVVTLVPGKCSDEVFGRLYCLTPTQFDQAVAEIDAREKNGYHRLELDVTGTQSRGVKAVVYVANEKNPWIRHDESHFQIAERIKNASGPSGTNLEYFKRLKAFVDDHGYLDHHLINLDKVLKKIDKSTN